MLGDTFTGIPNSQQWTDDWCHLVRRLRRCPPTIALLLRARRGASGSFRYLANLDGAREGHDGAAECCIDRHCRSVIGELPRYDFRAELGELPACADWGVSTRRGPRSPCSLNSVAIRPRKRMAKIPRTSFPAQSVRRRAPRVAAVMPSSARPTIWATGSK